MKNTTRQWLIACICLFYFVPLSIAQKNLVMVHGLGGGVKSLGGYAAKFQNERQIGQAANFEHNSASGISAAAADARDKTIGKSPGHIRSADIGIGHSMGGLTVREMDRQAIQGNQEKMFGGFIALGAPNQGSKLVQSFNNGAVNNFLSDACKEVVADPILSIANLLTLGTTANVFVSILQNFDTQICNFAAKLLASGDAFAAFQTPSINDFGENAPFLNGSNGINSFTSLRQSSQLRLGTQHSDAAHVRRGMKCPQHVPGHFLRETRTLGPRQQAFEPRLGAGEGLDWHQGPGSGHGSAGRREAEREFGEVNAVFG